MRQFSRTCVEEEVLSEILYVLIYDRYHNCEKRLITPSEKLELAAVYH